MIDRVRDGLRTFAAGVAWNVVPSDAVTIVSWVIDPERSVELHCPAHPSARSGYVVEGEVTFHYAGERTQTYATGDRYALPAGTEYRQSSNDWTVLFDVYAPRHAAYEAAFATSDPGSAGTILAMNDTNADEAAIRERAYFLWEQDGRPDGRHEEHWFTAKGERVIPRDIEPIGEIAFAEAAGEVRAQGG